MKLVKFLLTPPISAISVALFAALSSFGDPKTYYVSPKGNGSDPTAGFATGYVNIQSAIDAASAGDTVLLDKATFDTSTYEITVNKKITLCGAGENWETVLDGGNNRGQITVTYDGDGSFIHSLTYTRVGNQWTDRLGLQVNRLATVSNIVVTGNGNAFTDSGHNARYPLRFYGGLVTHCWITNNIAPNNAGVYQTGGTMENCVIADNKDLGRCGSDTWAGVVVLAGNCTLRNCTILRNESNYSAVYVQHSSAKVYNNIIWGNTANGQVGNWLFKDSSWATTNLKNNLTDPIDGLPEGNVCADPLFLSDGIHIQSGSPCRGAADKALAPAYDMDGVPRGDNPSIGCMEYVAPLGFTCMVSPSAELVELPDTITLSVTFDGTPVAPVSYEWDYNGDGIVDSTEEHPVLDASGKYNVSVKVTDAAGVSASDTCGKTLGVSPKGGFVVYVSPDGDGTNPYGGFATGLTTVQGGIDFAEVGETVMLDRRTFVIDAQLNLSKAITLRGAGENWESVIDGKGEIDAMTLTAVGALLHNFTLTNCGGMWAGSAGINMSSASTISNVVFRGIGNQWTGNQGTRFPLTASAGLITHCWITNNIAPKNAGAWLKGTAVMENCYIADNVDRGVNLAENQNGIVVLSDSRATLRNCTIVNNDSPLDAVFVYANGKVYNNIIRNNTAGGGIGNWKTKNASWLSNWANNCTEPLDDGFPAGNTADDPMLMPDNLHFFKDSPCNGTADATKAPAYDIHGNVRGETPSMGCLEYEAPQSGFYCSIQASVDAVTAPDTITLGVVLEGEPTGNLSYAWDFNGDGEVDSEEAQPVLSETGKYHVSVVLTDQAGETASASYAKTIQVAPQGGFKIYVSPTGDGTNPYGGFATGVTTLQAGVDLAVAGETVLLDKTTFVQTAAVSIKKPITVCGAGENGETVLDGNKGGNIIEVATDGTVFHSLTLTNFGGQWSEGLALTMSGNVIVSNVVFRGNGNNWTGAGDGTRFPCLVGGGLMTHCWITNNITPANAGIRLNGGTVENCYIADNVDRGCSSDKGRVGIVMVNGGTLRNCTIVNNQSAYGAVYYKSAAGKIYNNIIWGNTQVGSAEQNNWVFEGALSQDGWIANCTAPLRGTAENGNISENPLLQEDQMHFFRTSPCNGTANESYAPVTDLDGNERPTPPSMGAFEYVAGALACTISATATTVDQPNTSVLSCAFDGEVKAPITYEWDLKGDGTLISHDANPSISEIGIYRPSVKAVDADGQTATGTFVGTITVYGEGGAVYVTAGENPNARAPFATAATAATSLGDAFGYAQAGKEIRLAAGTYYLASSFAVTKGVTITGVDGPEVTFVANTNNTDRLFDLRSSDAVLENVTIKGGNFQNNWGGAIVLLQPGTVRNCRFIGNLVSGHGAVRTEQSGSRIERCVFRGNCVPRNWIGGDQQGPTCVKLAGGNEKVVNCLFEANTNLNSESSTIYYSGVAVNVQSTSAQILNCTMVGNVSSNSQHAAICNDTLNGTYCEATVRNCISAGNTRIVNGETVPGNHIGAAPAKQSNSIVYPASSDYSHFERVLTVDPQFVDAAAGDYHLRATSPAVNGGGNLDYTAESIDLDGKARIYKFGLKSSKADMGCYESPYGTPGLSVIVR